MSFHNHGGFQGRSIALNYISRRKIDLIIQIAIKELSDYVGDSKFPDLIQIWESIDLAA